MDNGGPETTSGLLSRTLETTTHLRYNLRRLLLGVYGNNYNTTRNHLKILQHCPNIQHLKIIGYHESLVEEYKKLLFKLASLRTLRISIHCLEDCETDYLLDDVELLELIRELSCLRDVLIPLRFVNVECRRDVLEYCQLRQIRLRLDCKAEPLARDSSHMR